MAVPGGLNTAEEAGPGPDGLPARTGWLEAVRRGLVGRCPACESVPGPTELLVRPGPGLGAPTRSDRISMALRDERPLLTPF